MGIISSARVVLCWNAWLYNIHFATLSGDIRLKLCLERLNEVIKYFHILFNTVTHISHLDWTRISSLIFTFPTGLISLRSIIELSATERKELKSLCELTDADYRLCGQMDIKTWALTWLLWCHLCWPACPPYIPNWRRRPGWSLRTQPRGTKGGNTPWD